MALIELTTNLKSLNNKQTGAKSLLVSKDINDPPKTGGIAMQANARIDDLVRHTKLLVRKPGLKFLGNQALLAQTNIKQDIAKFTQKDQDGNPLYTGKQKLKALGDRAKKTAIDTALATASILAQIPVNGTGTHLIRGLKDVSYLGRQGMKQAHLSAPDGSIIPNNPANGPEDGGTFIIPDNFSITQLGATKNNKYNSGREWKQVFGKFTGKSNKDYIGNESSEPRKLVKAGNKAFVSNTGDLGWNPPRESALEFITSSAPTITVNKVGKASRSFKQRPDEISTESMYLQDEQTQIVAAGNKVESLQNVGVSPGVDPISGSSIHKSYTNEASITVKPVGNQEAKTYPQRPNVGHEDSSQQNIHDINIDGTEVFYSDQIEVTGNKAVDASREDREARASVVPLVDKPDPVQSLAKQTESILGSDKEDIIPFEFNTFYPGNTSGNFLYFRAFLGSFSDNFTGDWAGTKYVGRAEEFYTYQGFKRDISFDFQIAAFSKADLEPLYEKINLLVGATAPTYGDGSFMKGTLTKITIGDYLKQVSGFIGSVGLSWDLAHSWELQEEGKRLPHVLSCNVSFTPIHDFVPTATSTFIG